MPQTSTATLTEYLPAADNQDPSIEGAAALTHVQNGAGVWSVDGGEPLDADPNEYRVECEDCGEAFGSWGQAIQHADAEHPGLGDRTSILAYETEVETLNRAKRHLEVERDEDLALHEALVLLAEDYLDDA